MNIPKVFISYSHDSLEHKQWVLELATRLRNNGVESIIDQWELQAGDDLPLFMERNLSDCDRVIMVCTDRYVEKADAGSGGGGYEKMIVTSELSQKIDSNKIIPIIRQSGTNRVPIFLQTKLFIDFSSDENFEYSYDNLVRTIHVSPLFKKPPVGNNPFKGISDTMPEKSVDSFHEAMKIIIGFYEKSGSTEIPLRDFYSNNDVMSRALFDLQVDIAKEKGFVTVDLINRLTVLTEGRKYAIEHHIVS